MRRGSLAVAEWIGVGALLSVMVVGGYLAYGMQQKEDAINTIFNLSTSLFETHVIKSYLLKSDGNCSSGSGTIGISPIKAYICSGYSKSDKNSYYDVVDISGADPFIYSEPELSDVKKSVYRFKFLIGSYAENYGCYQKYFSDNPSELEIFLDCSDFSYYSSTVDNNLEKANIEDTLLAHYSSFFIEKNWAYTVTSNQLATDVNDTTNLGDLYDGKVLIKIKNIN